MPADPRADFVLVQAGFLFGLPASSLNQRSKHSSIAHRLPAMQTSVFKCVPFGAFVK